MTGAELNEKSQLNGGVSRIMRTGLLICPEGLSAVGVACGVKVSYSGLEKTRSNEVEEKAKKMRIRASARL